MQSRVLATIIVAVVFILCCVCIGVALQRTNRAWRKREDEKFRARELETPQDQRENGSSVYEG